MQARTSSTRANVGLDVELVQRIRSVVSGDTLALVLYGSHARGSARINSDIDVLQVVSARARSYSCGSINISAYHIGTLKDMARRGSLFVLHLCVDAAIIDDSEGLFTAVLAAYKPPANYSALYTELRVAAQALQPSIDSPQYAVALRRLGIYILRTAVYARLAERGTPVFDTECAAEVLADSAVTAGLALRLLLRSESSQRDLSILLEGISAIVGPIPGNRWGGIEALAIEASVDHPYAASLISQAIAGAAGALEYTALALPPL